MEDYLAAIYRSLATGEKVGTSQVARRLHVSSASTTHMFRKMAAEGLVDYREYEGVSLTPAGHRAALSLIRRHRLAERFLTDVLGISWDKVDPMADRMEHALPAEVVDGFEALLHGPATCPHGHPIPSRTGTILLPPTALLSTLPRGFRATVAWVREDDPGLLQHLAAIGLVPGARVLVRETGEVDDVWVLETPVGTHTAGRRVAEAVSVYHVPDSPEK